MPWPSIGPATISHKGTTNMIDVSGMTGKQEMTYE